MLTLDHLTVGYGTRAVLTDICAELPYGHIAVLVGANGAGKSTLLRAIAGVSAPLSGTVAIDGVSPSALNLRRRARLLSTVYTDRSNVGLTVRETVAIGRQPYTGFFGNNTPDDRHRIARALEQVGMAAFADRHLSSLSDGEHQKVMIAKALAQDTPVLLLDEPTSFLDVASRLEILQLLRRLADEESKTILLSTHDIAPALAVADAAWVLAGGRLRACANDDAATLTLAFSNRGIRFDSRRGDFVINTD